MRKITFLMLMLLMLAIVLPVFAQSEASATLDTMIPPLMEEHGVPGVAIALVENGEVTWVQSYGLADVESQTPVTEDTLFSVASIGKAFTVWGTMQLVQEGVLDLDAPVSTYLTRWQLPASRYDHDQVTIRRILSHTAGLGIGGYRGTPLNQPLPTIEEKLSEFGVELKVITEPGTAFRYSGGGYLLLQLIIEEVTGQRFEDFITERVLQPLNITASTIDWSAEAHGAVTATAYDRRDRALDPVLHLAKASGGLYMTAGDLAAFVAAHLDSSDPAGRGLLTADSLHEILIPADATEGEYASGYFVRELADGSRVDWHDGIQPGWRTLFTLDETRQDGIVILTNSENGYALITPVVCAWAGEDRAEFCEQVRSYEG